MYIWNKFQILNTPSEYHISTLVITSNSHLVPKNVNVISDCVLMIGIYKYIFEKLVYLHGSKSKLAL
jgi:hypothetical protein